MNFLDSVFPLKVSNSFLNGEDGFLIYSSQQASSKIYGRFPVYCRDWSKQDKHKTLHKILVSHLPKKDVSCLPKLLAGVPDELFLVGHVT